MMDKKTLLIMAGCMILMIGTQVVVNKIYPPIPKKQRPVTMTATNAVPTNVTAVVSNIVEAVAPVKVESDRQRPEEQTVTLRNDDVNVTLTSWGGGIRSVELLKYKANGHGSVVLNGTNDVPALAIAGLPGAGATDAFQVEKINATNVVMRTHTPDGLAITKTFTLSANYLINVSVDAQPTGAGATLKSAAFVVGTAAATHPKEIPSFLCVDWQGGPKFFDMNAGRVASNVKKGNGRMPIAARWVAVKSQYFAMLLTASTNSVAVDYATVNLPVPPDWKGKQPPQGVTATMDVPATTDGGSGAQWALRYYAGPKEYDRLAALGQNQDEVMDFGSWMDFYSGLFGMILFKSLDLIYKFIPSFGVAIVLVTVAIKIIFWPIQAKSIRSMKEMQKVAPLMAKLKEKYKDDAPRLNQETMKLYKEHGVNPFAGCLPMFVQLPVLIGFYKVLSNSIELRGAHFLWIKDLSQPDTVLTVAGLPVNPLPLVMVGTMIWQQKITPTTGDAQQAKMMMFMPLMMLMFFYNSSSGLALYWTVQQILSIAQQYLSMRQTNSAVGGVKPLIAGKSK